MEYQLVFQFPGAEIADYDALIELEDHVINAIGEAGIVDGHDFGSGEMNLFIHTNDPQNAFKAIQEVLPGDLRQGVKAAYRNLNEEKYTWLYPKNSRGDFAIE